MRMSCAFGHVHVTGRSDLLSSSAAMERVMAVARGMDRDAHCGV